MPKVTNIRSFRRRWNEPHRAGPFKATHATPTTIWIIVLSFPTGCFQGHWLRMRKAVMRIVQKMTEQVANQNRPQQGTVGQEKGTANNKQIEGKGKESQSRVEPGDTSGSTGSKYIKVQRILGQETRMHACCGCSFLVSIANNSAEWESVPESERYDPEFLATVLNEGDRLGQPLGLLGGTPLQTRRRIRRDQYGGGGEQGEINEKITRTASELEQTPKSSS